MLGWEAYLREDIAGIFGCTHRLRAVLVGNAEIIAGNKHLNGALKHNYREKTERDFKVLLLAGRVDCSLGVSSKAGAFEIFENTIGNFNAADRITSGSELAVEHNGVQNLNLSAGHIVVLADTVAGVG